MKIRLLLLAVFCATPALAAPVSPTDAKNYVDKTITVEGVASVHTIASGMTFINLGGRGKGAPFTGVIFKEHASEFTSVDSFDGKTVDITGIVKMFEGAPEIVLEKPDQISVK